MNWLLCSPRQHADHSTSRQVLEYCEHHRGDPLPPPDSTDNDDARKRTTDISEWDQKFITVDQEMLFEIILAANYLDIKPLLCVFYLFLRVAVSLTRAIFH